MRVEAHRGSNLASLLPRSHVPHDPLGLLRRATIDEAVSFCRSLDSIAIDARCSEIHARCTHHLSCMRHLVEASAIVVCLLYRFDRHLFYERRYSGAVVPHKTITCSFYFSFTVNDDQINLHEALLRFADFTFFCETSLQLAGSCFACFSNL